MASPKLYLFLLDGFNVLEVKTLRDLEDAIHVWSENENTITGILHCAFMRPSLSMLEETPRNLKGKVLYTSSMQGAMPESFPSVEAPSLQVELNKKDVFCYLAVEGWGYELDAHSASLEIHDVQKNRHFTISQAAQEVLREYNNTPQTSTEIYDKIIESEYYQFNTPNPVHVLDVTLNRETLGTNYSKASSKPLFGKTDDNKYYLLGEGNHQPEGWFKKLSQDDPKLFEEICKLGVFDDQTFLEFRKHSCDSFLPALEHKRFHCLLETIDKRSPSQILKIAPLWLLNLHILELGLSVRPLNCLQSKGIEKPHELLALTTKELKEIPNMGNGSIVDICRAIIRKVDAFNTAFIVNDGEPGSANQDQSNEPPPLIEMPLISLVQASLDKLAHKQKVILNGRLGLEGEIKTLEELGSLLGVTRERIRQIAKKVFSQIIAVELWDDFLRSRIDALFEGRQSPLQLEILDIEDAWFEGFEDNFIYLGQVIETFSCRKYKVVEDQGRHFIIRPNLNSWHEIQGELSKMLKSKSLERKWNRAEIRMHISSLASKFELNEFAGFFEDQFSKYLKYDGDSDDSILVDYGKSAEQAVSAVLYQAVGPMHYEKIAKEATKIYGKKVDARLAHNAAARHDDVFLYDRGTYGLIKHCPIATASRKAVCEAVEDLLYSGPINKQWHSKEIIDQLYPQFPEIQAQFNPYVLRMSIEGSPRISFLNRMVWARADSGLGSGDRIETNKSFIQILEEAGEPLSGKELKRRLSKIRGVSEYMQIHASDRLVAVGPNIWGLAEWASTSINQ